MEWSDDGDETKTYSLPIPIFDQDTVGDFIDSIHDLGMDSPVSNTLAWKTANWDHAGSKKGFVLSVYVLIFFCSAHFCFSHLMFFFHFPFRISFVLQVNAS